MIKELFAMLRDWFSGEVNTVRSLQSDKRAGYIWDYHKWKIIISSAVIFCICGLLWTNVFNHKNTAYAMAVVNQRSDVRLDKDREMQLIGLFGLDAGREKVSVDSAYQIVWETTLDDYRQYADYDRFFLNISNNQIDCAILPEGFLRYCMELDDIVYPLTDLIGDTDGSRLCFVDGIPYGIYVDGTEWDNGTASGRAVACFPVTGNNFDRSVLLARSITGSE